VGITSNKRELGDVTCPVAEVQRDQNADVVVEEGIIRRGGGDSLL